jgi:hypothetical protein
MNTLTFQTVLDSEVVHLPDAEKLLGKQVVITVVEVSEEPRAGKRTWNYLGSIRLDAALDHQNIRDLAHD